MSNYANSLYNDYEKEIIERKRAEKQNKLLKLRNDILESENQRLEKAIIKIKQNVIEEKQKIINEKEKEIEALKSKIVELTKELDLTKYERDRYLAKLNIDGTTAGIPTSQTPINKKKIIPNSRKKTDNKIGGQENHKKHKLEKFEDDEINEHEDIILEECPHCHSNNLVELESEITKDEFDYQIKIIKKRIHFKEYICSKCNNVVRKNIPVNLKEDNQYGTNVQATALTLTNIGNVPMNKTRKIISGLTMNEIDLSEGYIAKLQKRAALKLTKFIDDLKFYITHLNLVYWDDTVIMINTQRGCMRFYGNEDVALYCAHTQKNKAGLDKDNILSLLPSNTIVEHDHNIVNYNEEYSFINAECCQHLNRDLQKVKTNIPSRTWSIKMKDLFCEYDHKRKLLMEQNIDHFSEEEFDNFISQINQCLLLGVEEYSNDSETYYASEEAALLIRLMDIDKELEKIFNNDELNLLNVKPKVSNSITSDERLVRSFEEINDFIDKNGKLPEANTDNILERSLCYRLQGIMEDGEKVRSLKQYDRHDILAEEIKAPETLDDIFADDEFDLLSDDVDIFTLKNVPKEIAKTDFVARRKPCANFEEYEEIFKKCQNELKYGIRTLEKFNEKQIEEGQMFVLNGVLVYVDKLYNIKKDKNNKDDGRTHLIFENGTESNMLFRSFGKGLFINGKHVTNTVEEKMRKFNNIQDEDKPTGYIYVLQSKSRESRIKELRHLYKIGYCETTVEERIKNAANEPTYLMAPVKKVSEFKTYNMNTQKFEDLLHRFLGHCQVSIDVFDNNGTRHTPREWFQVPLEVIEQAIKLIVTGEVVNYRYDRETKTIQQL